MFQDISIEELIELQKDKKLTLIDVRSEKEFEDSTMPGSINIPLFNNEERHEVGTLYKQFSKKAAKDKGLEIVSRKLPKFIKEFENLPANKAVFCWRGGMRSKTTATVLSLMNIRVYRLLGGIRAYRNWVIEELERFQLHSKCIVINGYTGSGKTEILKALAERGFPVLDLEGLAQHRGSIFGQIGLEPHNQKTFEALLIHELHRIKDEPYFLVEAESKRIGKVVLPEMITQAKETGTVFFIDMPLEQRVQHIIREYQPSKYKEACIEAFMKIKKKIHTPVANQIHKCLLNDEFEEAVSLMLEYYYDSRYEHAMEQYERNHKVIKVKDIDEAVEKLSDQISLLNCNNSS
jgi:tRNA 2-selenouridine synthase